ncbi:MAG: hypothetical protein RM338_11405 [Nostoc sp. DedQUE12a]|nr:hypothetical protein [Nostoc sp. DedQUE12a]
MANINIDDIKNQNLAGSDFFGDNESYLSELTEDAISGLKVWGGTLELSGEFSLEGTIEIPGLSTIASISALTSGIVV